MNVTSEITGPVWKLVAAAGDAFEAGDVILLMESMKMEVPVVAERKGRLARLAVQEGDAVVEGQLLAVIDPA
jgi:acetyl-CoA carboxylase biotin carboxyl carrier protein